MNVQFAVKGSDVYILEVNPRASRTVPFVSKAIGVPLAKLAARVMVGEKLGDSSASRARSSPPYVSVKEAVFPFAKFPGVDTLLGPEMKSTGEVMGIDASFGVAFAKAQIAAGTRLPLEGIVFLSVQDADKAVAAAGRAQRWPRAVSAWWRRAARRRSCGRRACRSEPINKVQEGSPHVVDAIRAGEIVMVINTPAAVVRTAIRSRSAAPRLNVRCRTSPPSPAPTRRRRGSSTCSATSSACRSLQEYHRTDGRRPAARRRRWQALCEAWLQARRLAGRHFVEASERPLECLAAPRHRRRGADAGCRARELAAPRTSRAGGVRSGRARRRALEALARPGRLRSAATAAARHWLALIEALLIRLSRTVPRSRRGRACRATGAVAATSPPASRSSARSVQFVSGVGPRRADELRKFGSRPSRTCSFTCRSATRTGVACATIAAAVAGASSQLRRRVGAARGAASSGGRGGVSWRRVLRDETGLLGLTWYNQVAYFRDRFRRGQQVPRVRPRRASTPAAASASSIPRSNASRASVRRGDRRRSTTSRATCPVEAMRKLVQQAVRGFRRRWCPACCRRGREPAGSAISARRCARCTAGDRTSMSTSSTSIALARASLAGVRRAVLSAARAGLAAPRSAREAGLRDGARGPLAARLHRRLPFALTGAQRRVLDEIAADMARPHPMHRLVQGDVGSGKTVVALVAALIAVAERPPGGVHGAHRAARRAALRADLRVGAKASICGVALLTGERLRSERDRSLRRSSATARSISRSAPTRSSRRGCVYPGSASGSSTSSTASASCSAPRCASLGGDRARRPTSC